MAEAGGVGKAISNAAMKKVLRRDLARDMSTAAKPLPRDKVVWRYTNRRQLSIESSRGLSPNTHMTSRIQRGRPLTAQTAQSRYGLAKQPTFRETIRIPRGQPVRLNKALGGKPGVGEATSPTRISSNAIIRMDPVRKSTRAVLTMGR